MLRAALPACMLLIAVAPLPTSAQALSGRRLVAALSKEGSAEIYLLGTDGTDIERLTPNDANYTSPAWSPL